VARSFYKGPNLGSTPACAICVGKGQGKRAPLHLPGGVSVWLCAAHRDPGFLRSRAGRDIVVSLMHVWRSAGCFTARRSQALTALEDQLVIAPGTPARPGSYAWPTVRLEAERRFAAGEDPVAVIADLRNREAERTSPARPPSVRTMRRWFREGRWRDDGADDPEGPGPQAEPPGPEAEPPGPQAGPPRSSSTYPPDDVVIVPAEETSMPRRRRGLDVRSWASAGSMPRCTRVARASAVTSIGRSGPSCASLEPGTGPWSASIPARSVPSAGGGAVAITGAHRAPHDSCRRPGGDGRPGWRSRGRGFPSVRAARLRRCSAGSRSSPSWQPCSPPCRGSPPHPGSRRRRISS
jgi:hypothetical protein